MRSMLAGSLVLFLATGSAIAAPVIGVQQEAPDTARNDPAPRLLGRWSVAMSAGMPQTGAIAVGRTIGRDWRVVGEAGTLYGIVFSGVLRVDRYLRRLGPVTLYATATAAIMYVTGLSWGGVGPSGADKGIGLGLGVEHQFGFGMTVSAGLGLMVGEWGDSFGSDEYVVPEMTLYRIGYAW